MNPSCQSMKPNTHYRRDDGLDAYVVSVSREHVYFRRHADGELMRVSAEAFFRRYSEVLS